MSCEYDHAHSMSFPTTNFQENLRLRGVAMRPYFFNIAEILAIRRKTNSVHVVHLT